MSVNKVILIGRLGQVPETRRTGTGDAVTNFSLATDEQWKDKNGQKQTRTEWHNITMFGKLGEIASQYLRKGDQVFIEGQIRSSKYSTKDGVERTAYNIIAAEMRMLGGRNTGTSDSKSGKESDNALVTSSENAKKSAKQQHQPNPSAVDDIDDDIPF